MIIKLQKCNLHFCSFLFLKSVDKHLRKCYFMTVVSYS